MKKRLRKKLDPLKFKFVEFKKAERNLQKSFERVERSFQAIANRALQNLRDNVREMRIPLEIKPSGKFGYYE